MLATTNDGVDDDAHLLKFRKKTWGFIFKRDLLWCYIQQKRKRFINKAALQKGGIYFEKRFWMLSDKTARI